MVHASAPVLKGEKLRNAYLFN